MPMRSTRLAIGATIALAVAIMPAAAVAHAELVSSAPAADETLAIPPETVTIVFDGELAPDGTGFTVTDPDADVVGEGGLDLTVAERNEIHGDVRIRQPGTYTVAWTAVAADGHEETGEFAFTVAGPPDTAALPASPDLLVLLGAGFLLGGVGVARLHARRRAS
jgi:methionine-rich copper-binding protein CopC